MWNIIIRIQYHNGGTSIMRVEDYEPNLDYWERLYGPDPYSKPDVASAVCVNAFYVEEVR